MWRLGIVGCGWAGQRHVEALASLQGRARVTAATDTDSEAAERLIAGLKDARAFADLDALLASGSVDAVHLCLPHSLHAVAATAAASAGVHVLVEKPLAATLAEADTMIAAAETHRVVLMVAETARFRAEFERAAGLVQEGAIGDVFLIRVERLHHMHDYLRARPWFLTDPAGGIMASGGIHDFEVVRMLGGEVLRVYAQRGPSTLPEMRADDTSVAVAELARGATAVVVESFSAHGLHPAVRGSVYGTAGSLWFEQDVGVRMLTGSGGGDPEPVDVQLRDPFVAEIAHFLDCLESGRTPITDGRDQRHPLATVLAAYASMESGQPEPVI